jgi:hypothetical protein
MTDWEKAQELARTQHPTASAAWFLHVVAKDIMRGIEWGRQQERQRIIDLIQTPSGKGTHRTTENPAHRPTEPAGKRFA